MIDISDKKSILMIEDEADVSEIFVEAFDAFDIGVVTAVSKNEALFKLNNQKFDCIISDIKLKNSDASHVFKELSKGDALNYDVPVIIYSGHINKEILVDFKKMIKGAFVKPTELKEIVKKVATLCLQSAS